jgi:hypothetical protein
LFVAETNRGWGSVGGQPHGLERIRYTGQVPFEMHSLSITPGGWTVRFTKPIDRQKAADSATYSLQSYTYHYHATYGSPEIDRQQHEIAAIEPADDNLSLHLTVPQRGKRRVYHLQFKGLAAQDGSPLVHPDAWYTLNDVPQATQRVTGSMR